MVVLQIIRGRKINYILDCRSFTSTFKKNSYQSGVGHHARCPTPPGPRSGRPASNSPPRPPSQSPSRSKRAGGMWLSSRGAPPTTLVEFSLRRCMASIWPVLVAPQERAMGYCNAIPCSANILSMRCTRRSCRRICRMAAWWDAGVLAWLLIRIGYSCRGAYGIPNACEPTNYSQIFKNAYPRPHGYYAYGGGSSTFICAGDAYLHHLPSISITFRPWHR